MLNPVANISGKATSDPGSGAAFDRSARTLEKFADLFSQEMSNCTAMAFTPSEYAAPYLRASAQFAGMVTFHFPPLIVVSSKLAMICLARIFGVPLWKPAARGVRRIISCTRVKSCFRGDSRPALKLFFTIRGGVPI